ncbi:MAG: hypothetical protein HOW97_12255 [Catenulispora sp.]|nr:hypothetical protein [Catenulispora sp.]
MAADAPTPLITWAQLTEGAFKDLVRSYTGQQAQTDLLLEATRLCEDHCDRRLAPFTAVVESQRAIAMDVEDTLDAYIPLDPTSQLGLSRAQSLGSTLLVRHCWVREFPPRYPELWQASVQQIELRRSFSGSQLVDTSQIQFEPDTGHVRFALGTFVPAGTTVLVTYSGGYQTVPASLARAAKYMAASLAVTELDPVGQTHGHDQNELRAQAEEALAVFVRG